MTYMLYVRIIDHHITTDMRVPTAALLCVAHLQLKTMSLSGGVTMQNQNGRSKQKGSKLEHLQLQFQVRSHPSFLCHSDLNITHSSVYLPVYFFITSVKCAKSKCTMTNLLLKLCQSYECGVLYASKRNV